MAYIVIEDFRAGLDRRKMPEASPPGTLQELVNGHITRGGEIEKRRAMVPLYALPPGQTFGFAAANGVLYTFGSDDSPNVPPGVTYQRLEHPDEHAMDAIVRTEFYDGKIWAVAHYTNGDTLAFYDGTIVADWDAGSGLIVAGKAATDILTVRDKVYTTFDSILAFSGVAEPTVWDPDEAGKPGAGFVNMANQSAGSEALTGLGRYQNLVAVFARRNTQIWYVDADPLQNAQRQVLENIGTLSPKTIVSFGQVDLFFLSDTGVRSLRARDSSNQAGVSDVGTPVDDMLVDYMADLPEQTIREATGVFDPRDGRYVMSIADRTFVFSYYSTTRISAWSEYDYGFRVDDYVSMDGKIYARGEDTIFLFGGATGKEFDTSQVTVVLPYIDGRQIATFKSFQSLDVVAEGVWQVYAGTEPAAPEAMTLLATINGTSLNKMKLGMVAHAPLIRLKFVCISDGPAKLSKVILHYHAAESG
jgi:hypothetical protein